MPLLLSLSLALLWLAMPTAEATPVTYLVEVDTTIAQGSDGYLDFQFNPDGTTFQDATTSVTNFLTDALLDGSSIADGGGSGILPGTLFLNNRTPFNAVLQGLSFGSFLSFELTISGDAIDSPIMGSGTTLFSLSLLDSAFNPLLTTDVFGHILEVLIQDDGGTTVTVFNADNTGTPSVVTVTVGGTTAPAPSSLALLFPAALLMLVSHHRRI
jgi:hypothetical protein